MLRCSIIWLQQAARRQNYLAWFDRPLRAWRGLPLVRPAESINGEEANEIRRRHGWEIVGSPSL
jgi:hypothetical protein